jgi:hypothetical protein
MDALQLHDLATNPVRHSIAEPAAQRVPQAQICKVPRLIMGVAHCARLAGCQKCMSGWRLRVLKAEQWAAHGMYLQQLHHGQMSSVCCPVKCCGPPGACQGVDGSTCTHQRQTQHPPHTQSLCACFMCCAQGCTVLQVSCGAAGVTAGVASASWKQQQLLSLFMMSPMFMWGVVQEQGPAATWIIGGSGG